MASHLNFKNANSQPKSFFGGVCYCTVPVFAMTDLKWICMKQAVPQTTSFHFGG